MDLGQVTDLSATGLLALFLFKWLLPEIRKVADHLSAIEKHLARAGQRQESTSKAIDWGQTAILNDTEAIKKQLDFVVSRIQSNNGRSTDV